jgi:hypothetical protein
MEEEIRGTILIKENKLVLKYNSAETETFALSHYPSFQVGFNFIRHKGLLYYKK